jgi:lauroyl/myristoyl acyltransferase
MKMPHRASQQRREVLYSPVLHLGSVTVSERVQQPRRRLFSGTRLKAHLFPLLHFLILHTPVVLAMLPARIITAVLHLLYLWPGNPLRRACQDICKLAETAGRNHNAKEIYHRFLANALGVIDNFFTLYRHGSERVLPRIRMDGADTEQLHQLIEHHGGLILAVPHNIGSAFSALAIGHNFDMLLVAKNSPTIRRTRIALDFYEQMDLSLLMVRGGNPVELSRTLFSVLKQGKLVAATLDNIDRTDNAIPTVLFGQGLGLSGWAAKIAARMQVPLVPAYFRSNAQQIELKIGKALLANDANTIVQAYASFFEQEILDDPASWAYLADKHWQTILKQAAGR